MGIFFRHSHRTLCRNYHISHSFCHSGSQSGKFFYRYRTHVPGFSDHHIRIEIPAWLEEVSAGGEGEAAVTPAPAEEELPEEELIQGKLTSDLQRQPLEEEEEPIQAKPAGARESVAPRMISRNFLMRLNMLNPLADLDRPRPGRR